MIYEKLNLMISTMNLTSKPSTLSQETHTGAYVAFMDRRESADYETS